MATAQGYNVAIPGWVDYEPSFADLIGESVGVLAQSSTQMYIEMSNGLRLRIYGTGFSYDADGNAIGGTVTTIRVYLGNGTTIAHQVSGLNESLEDMQSAAQAFSGWGWGKWILRGNDTIRASASIDQDLYGHAGNDTLIGSTNASAATYMDGGLGVDTYQGGASFDQLSFQEAYFDPTAFRGVLVNAVAGTAIDPWGNNETFTSIESFRGTQFNDSFIGSAADEQFMGLGGRDTIDGGGGVDEVRYHRDPDRGATAGVTVNLATGVAIDGFGTRDTLSNIENIRATIFDDTLTGSSVANRIRAHEGNDTINGGVGADNMIGGAGDDTYYVDNAGDIVNESSDGGSGQDRVFSTISFNLTANGSTVLGGVENLTLLGSGNLTGTGNGLANTLTGNTGVNTLSGGAGNDRLVGGLGNDTLTGGADADVFVFNTAMSTTNIETITDFNAPQDTIELENAIFTALTTTGTLAANLFKDIATGARDADDRIFYNSANGALYYDADGSGAGFASVRIGTLTGAPIITAADFVVV